MIQYRTFRNPDPPRIANAWNACFAGPRAVVIPPHATSLLEFFTLSKPYFDRDGIILALDEGQPIGLAHAGFASAGPDAWDVNPAIGIICTLGVAPTHRRKRIGTELLHRMEDYLSQRGATEILAGASAPMNPFSFGLYGGADSIGFLASEPSTQPFFEKHGYKLAWSTGLFQRILPTLPPTVDSRFASIHPRYEILGAPYSRAGWYRESVLGPIEAVQYRLQEKDTGDVAGRILLWDMATFGYGWGDTCVGMLEFEIEEHFRRQGHGKYLLTQVLAHLQQQSFGRFEACLAMDNVPALALFQGLGFEQVDTGHCYRRG